MNYINISPTATIDEKVHAITEFIVEAAKISIPISKGAQNGKIPLPWFNEECKKVHRERKRAARALKHNHNQSNMVAYRRLNALCRWTFKKAKKETWMQYLTSINVRTSMSQVWKRINKVKGKFCAHPTPLL